MPHPTDKEIQERIGRYQEGMGPFQKWIDPNIRRIKAGLPSPFDSKRLAQPFQLPYSLESDPSPTPLAPPFEPQPDEKRPWTTRAMNRIFPWREQIGETSGKVTELLTGSFAQGAVEATRFAKDLITDPSLSLFGELFPGGGRVYPSEATQKAIDEYTKEYGAPPSPFKSLEIAKEADPLPWGVRGTIESLPFALVPQALAVRARLVAPTLGGLIKQGPIKRIAAKALEPLADTEAATGAVINKFTQTISRAPKPMVRLRNYFDRINSDIVPTNTPLQKNARVARAEAPFIPRQNRYWTNPRTTSTPLPKATAQYMEEVMGSPAGGPSLYGAGPATANKFWFKGNSDPTRVVDPLTRGRGIAIEGGAPNLAPGLTANPTELGKNVLDMRPIQIGLTKYERVANWISGVVNPKGQRPYHPVVSGVFKEIRRVRPINEGQAVVIGPVSGAEVDKVFVRDTKGRITNLLGIDKSLRGAPTIQDLAARYPLFVSSLSKEQRVVMDRLRSRFKDYSDMMDDVGLDIGERVDIIKGGFYLARGRAGLEGSEEAIPNIVTGRRKGKRSFEKTARYPSMSEAIDDGYEYSPFDEAMGWTIKDIGDRSLNRHIANSLLGATDADGRLFATTAADRIVPWLRTQVGVIRSKTAARRLTLMRQEVQVALTEREAIRLQREADNFANKYAAAEARYEIAYLEGSTDDLIKAAEKELALLLRNEQKLGTDAARRAGIGKATAAELKRLEQAELALVELLDGAGTRFLRRAEFSTSEAVIVAAERELNILLRETRKATRRVTEATDRMKTAGDRATAATDAEKMAKNLVDALRVELRNIPLEGSPAGVVAMAKREASLMGRELKRAANSVQRGAARADGAKARYEATAKNYDELRDELIYIMPEWKRAQSIAKDTPRGHGAIDLDFLQGYAFPDDIVSAARKQLKQMDPKGALLDDTVIGINQIHRGFAATADNSAVGIQGLFGWASQPKASFDALWVSMQAWGIGGDKTLGRFFLDYDNAARLAGMPTSQDWARRGLHIGGAKSEMMLGQGVTRKLANLPLIRQANRAYGYYGDTLRLGWAHNELADLNALAASKGTKRSLQEMLDSGEMEKIAEIVSRVTGFAPTRTFGRVGDILIFAPRFLQARLATLARGSMGMAKGGTATLEERIARRAVLRLVGYAVLLTEAANRMQGQETDYRFIVDGRKNHNFMRIRYRGRDYSLLGHMDSMAGMIVAVGSSIHEKSPDPMIFALRSMGSGIVKNLWDFGSGTTAVGDPTRDNPTQVALRIAENFVPFSGDEMGAIFSDAAEAAEQGDVGGVVAGGIAAGAEIHGIKSSPLSGTDRTGQARVQALRRLGPDFARKILADQNMDVPVDDEDAISEASRLLVRTPNIIGKTFLYDLDQDPEVLAVLEERRDQQSKKKSKWKTYVALIADADTKADKGIAEAADQYRETVRLGLKDGQEFINAVQIFQHDRVIEKNTIRELNKDTLAFIEEMDPPTGMVNTALDAYYRSLYDVEPPLEDPVSRNYDYRRHRKIVDDWRRKYPEVADDVLELIRGDEHELVAELREDRETLRGYWDITDAVIDSNLYRIRDLWERYHAKPIKDRETFLLRLEREQPEQYDKFNNAKERISQWKELMRGNGENDCEIDRLLLKWGYVSKAKCEGLVRKERLRQLGVTGNGSSTGRALS